MVLAPSELAGDSGSGAGVTMMQFLQGTPCQARNDAIKISPCGMFPIPAFSKPGKGQIQSGSSLCKARNDTMEFQTSVGGSS